MAQLLSPVCTDSPLKFQNPWRRQQQQSFCSTNRWRILANNSFSFNRGRHGRNRRGFGRMKVATDDSPTSFDAIADDYYSVLGLVSFSIDVLF